MTAVDAIGSGWEAGRPPGLIRLTSSQLVENSIRRMIFDGELRTGDRVRQDEIARRLGVSRIPVREAVIALDREGWLRSRPHRGAFVIGLDENSVRDHYLMQGKLYGLCARRAGERGTPDEVAQLAQQCAALTAEREPDDFWIANIEFQRHLLRIARSRRIVTIARLMTTAIIPGNFFAEVDGAMELQKEGMRAVVRALCAGDGRGAEAVFVTTLVTEAELVVALLSARGLVDPANP